MAAYKQVTNTENQMRTSLENNITAALKLWNNTENLTNRSLETKLRRREEAENAHESLRLMNTTG